MRNIKCNMDFTSFIFAWDNFLSHFCFLEMRILITVPNILSITWTGWILFELRPLCLDFFPINTWWKSVFECDNLVWRSSLRNFNWNILVRRSRPDVFCIKGVLRNYTNWTGKHMYQSLFLNKVTGLRPATLLRKRLWRRCFYVNFMNFFRTLFI